MILGFGNDICDIQRIEESLQRFGERFEKRIFTDAERAKAHSREGGGLRAVAATFAKRFAAKEAFAKALGTGMRDIGWRDMEVVSLPSGAPTMKISGRALKELQRLVPEGKEARIFLTLTDEYPYAQAQVIIEATIPSTEA